MTYTCPACGYDGLDEPAWRDGSPSDEICPSCGIQFGYSDWAGGNIEARQDLYAAWRRQWRADGMHWSSPDETPPKGWDPEAQLRRVSQE
jgi:hypothetical protein